MTFNRDRLLFKREPKDIVLTVNLPCISCGDFKTNSSDCKSHDVSTEEISLKVVGIPWARLNYIKSQAVSFNDDKTYFDGSYYMNECLKQMIIEAPWGKTDDIFLLQVNEYLGKALEKIVPKATSDDKLTPQQDFSEIKKE